MAIKYKDSIGTHDVSKIVYDNNEVGDLKWGDTWAWAKNVPITYSRFSGTFDDGEPLYTGYDYGYTANTKHEPTFTLQKYSKKEDCYYGCNITPYADTAKSWSKPEDVIALQVEQTNGTELLLTNPNSVTTNYEVKATFNPLNEHTPYSQQTMYTGTLAAGESVRWLNCVGCYVDWVVTNKITRRNYTQGGTSFGARDINSLDGATITIGEPEHSYTDEERSTSCSGTSTAEKVTFDDIPEGDVSAPEIVLPRDGSYVECAQVSYDAPPITGAVSEIYGLLLKVRYRYRQNTASSYVYATAVYKLTDTQSYSGNTYFSYTFVYALSQGGFPTSVPHVADFRAHFDPAYDESPTIIEAEYGSTTYKGYHFQITGLASGR